MTSGFFLRRGLLLLAAIAAPALLAQTADGEDFASCLQDTQQQARQQGLSPYLVEQVLPQLKSLPRVVELDRKQPEFVDSFADYLNRRVSDQRVARGRALMVEHRALLQQLTRQYGVPAQYLIAFWGLETNYGSYLGKMPVLDALLTLACDPRRSQFFQGELFSALRLLERERLQPQAMLGSWAGAMGHTQFMPSAYLRYAVDGDGDGRADLWRSSTDALSSAANFLAGLGWQREQRWGREVLLPEGFDYSLAGSQRSRSLAQWRELGLLTSTGAPLPVADMQGALLLPAGHRGPAFLVYQNFAVIMRWNRAESYALAVGYLADRINGRGRLARPPRDDQALSVVQLQALQQALLDRGYDSGAVDGILGPATRKAIREFQLASGLIADGYPHPAVFARLAL